MDCHVFHWSLENPSQHRSGSTWEQIPERRVEWMRRRHITWETPTHTFPFDSQTVHTSFAPVSLIFTPRLKMDWMFLAAPFFDVFLAWMSSFDFWRSNRDKASFCPLRCRSVFRGHLVQKRIHKSNNNPKQKEALSTTGRHTLDSAH